ncbi:MAG TPA: EAL domain-containing protein [Pseudomonadota bacterium]|nr:EAL domain-containing protein [Xanthomonadales bacterium]HQW82540.1 EAL domain-containing protein [Pseudomonadota bacterium]
MARTHQPHVKKLTSMIEHDDDGQLAHFALNLIACERLDNVSSICDPDFCAQFGIQNLRLLWRIGGGTGSDIHRGSSPALPYTPYLCDLIDHCPGDAGVTHPLDAQKFESGVAVSLGGPHLFTRAQLLLTGDPVRLSIEIETDAFQRYFRPLTLRVAELIDRERLRGSLYRLESAERLQRALYAIADLASAELEMPEMLAGIHDIVGDLMYAENFMIVQYDQARRRVRFIYFVDSHDSDTPDPTVEFNVDELQNSLTMAMLRHGRPLMGPSLQLRDELGVARDESFGPDSLDWLGVPMLAGSEVRGGIVVQTYDDSLRYSEEDRALLSYVAQHILTAMVRKQAHEDLEERVEIRTRELRVQIGERERGERLQAAYRAIAEAATNAETMDAFYREAHRIVGELLYAKNFFVALLGSDDTFWFPYAVDERDPLARFEPRKRGKTLTDLVMRDGHSLLASREQIRQLNDAGQVVSVGTPAACWLGVPLRGESGMLGVMAVQSYQQDVLYSARDEQILSFVSNHVALALERKHAQDSLRRAYAELERRVDERTRELADTNRELRDQIKVRQQIELRLKHEALHDALTGLPNRALLLDRLGHAQARFRRDPAHLFAVMFLDLDRFKIINDSVGHLVGDELLKEVSLRISGTLRADDTVARLGGDEFAVLIADVEDPENVIAAARRLIGVLQEPVRVASKELFTSASIGIALADARYTRAEELLRDADVAMYRAKAAGRQRVELFDERLHQEALRVLDLEGDLRRALGRNEFEPHFHAIVDLIDESVVGYEALLRWHHPERGLLLPGDFLEVADDTGCSEQIDWQMFDQVCAHIQGLVVGEQYVAINVAPRHFRSSDFLRRILDRTIAYGVPPHRLRIEITEGALLENPLDIRESLVQLRQQGILASLDDFGTGYSSLSYLHQFPIHALKIDRSFVSDLKPGLPRGNTAIVRAILALARSLNIEVVAEGIETSAQREALLELGCRFGQGFLFAHPRPAAEIVALKRPA